MTGISDDRPVPAALYRQVLEHMPIACVDIIIPSERGVLLVMRDNEPARGLWWLPGGRVLKGETLAACAVRKARDETGLECGFGRIVHVEETIFETGPWDIPVHTVNVCILLSLDGDREPRLDGDHSGARWISSAGELPLHGYIFRCLTASGIFEEG